MKEFHSSSASPPHRTGPVTSSQSSVLLLEDPETQVLQFRSRQSYRNTTKRRCQSPSLRPQPLHLSVLIDVNPKTDHSHCPLLFNIITRYFRFDLPSLHCDNPLQACLSPDFLVSQSPGSFRFLKTSLLDPVHSDFHSLRDQSLTLQPLVPKSRLDQTYYCSV